MLEPSFQETRLATPFLFPNSTGGRPNIADYDNDGQPEIGVGGNNRYAVIDFNSRHFHLFSALGKQHR